jgi:hypothetical protein
MNVKEVKKDLLSYIEKSIKEIPSLIGNDPDAKEFYEGEQAAYHEMQAYVEDIKAEGVCDLDLQVGNKYKCLHTLHYEDSGEVMFREGEVYIAISTHYGIGLMSTDGVARTNTDTCHVITDENFELVK